MANTAKTISTVLLAQLKLDDNCGHKEALEFIQAVGMFAPAFAGKQAFHNQVQAKMSGKWARANASANRSPDVKAAKALADSQEAIYLADIMVDTHEDGEEVLPGDYNLAGGTPNAPHSYWKLWCMQILKDGEIPWMKIFL